MGETKILIVEDDDALRRYLEESVGMMTREVRAVGSMAEAVGALRAEEPDAVVIDMTLPDGNGIALARSLRELVHHPVRVVLTSGAAGMHELARALGSAAFLEKPFTPEDLAAALQLRPGRMAS